VCSFHRVAPEIDVWRAVNLMLRRYGEKALEESAVRAEELAATATMSARRDGAGSRPAVAQLANKTPPGLVH
jgi:hypothetical protein